MPEDLSVWLLPAHGSILVTLAEKAMSANPDTHFALLASEARKTRDAPASKADPGAQRFAFHIPARAGLPGRGLGESSGVGGGAFAGLSVWVFRF